MSEILEYKGYQIKIEQDVDPESPRDWDNLGHMICFHRRYSLGDKTDLRSQDFDGWQDMRDHIERDLHAVVILPLFLYDHGGITMKTGSFQDPWDSGQVGFIYATRDDIRRNWNKKKVTKKLLADTERILESEVRVYDQYLTGDVYGYIITKEGEDMDSCWGYYGYNICLEEAQSIIDWRIQDEARVEAEASNRYLD